MKKFIMTMLIAFLLGAGICVQANEKVELTMVFVPASEKAQSNEFASLIDIVKEITDYDIKFINVSDYNAAVESMRAGRVELAWFGAKTYIQAAEMAGAEAFAAGIKKGDKNASYQVHFIVPKGSSITEFSREQLAGKSLALNHIGSTSGDLVPRFELNKLDLDTENKNHFKNVNYAGSHDAAIMAVVNKHADFAGVSSRNFDARIKDGTFDPADVTIIHSAYVPPPPLAYSKDLPQVVKDNIKAAVLDAHNHGEIGGYGGIMERYIPVEDKDFDELRDMNKFLKGKK